MKRHHIEYGLWTLAVLLILGLFAWGALVVTANGLPISVETTPPQASVWIDGHYLGTTPLTLEDVPPGEHVLRVTRHGHAPMVRRVRASAETPRLHFDLRKLPGGSLDVRSDPPGAEVFIDGESRGRTPVVVRELRPNTYALRLTLVNYLNWTGSFSIAPGQTVQRSVPLRSRTEAGYLGAILENPKNIEARTDLTHYYILRDEWTKAEDALTEALVVLAKHPGDTSHYATRLYQEVEKIFRMMFKYSDSDRGRTAVLNSFVRATRIVPKYELFYRIALHYAIDSNATARVRDVAEAGILKLPSSRYWLTSGLPRRISARRTADEEVTFLERRIAKRPGDFVCRLQLSARLRQRGRTAEALKQYDAMVPLAKSVRVKAQLLADMGKLWERRRDHAKAADAYLRAAKVETEKSLKASLHRTAARALGKAGRSTEELAAWEQAVTNQTDVEVACEWRLEWAKLCIRSKQKTRARTILNQVLGQSKNETTRSRAATLLNKT